MSFNQQQISTKKSSYWQLFRLIFTVVSLYTLGDVLYRWSGYKFYVPFSEFLPGVSLLAIIWSIMILFIVLLIWLPVRSFEWFCRRMGWHIKTESLLPLFICIFVLLLAIVWKGKKLFYHEEIPFQLKQVVLLCLTLATIFLTWLFRNKAERWSSIFQERITPLVWLFGMFVIFSVPLVAYHTLWKKTDNAVSQEITQAPITQKDRPNIIMLTFDSLTARDMSVYGYERPTTPFIAEWGKTASVFTMIQAENNFTTPALASLMTGKRLWTHQTYHLDGSKPVRSEIENLAFVLKKNGYYNIARIESPHATTTLFGISKSFHEINEEEKNKGRYAAFLSLFFDGKIRFYDLAVDTSFIPFRLIVPIINPLIMNFTIREMPIQDKVPETHFSWLYSVIDKSPPEPFFAWIHILPPHDYYLPGDPYVGMFDSSPELRTFESHDKVVPELSRWLEKNRHSYERQPTIDLLRARYDEFIRYCDNLFENFIIQLEKRNILKNTVIILSSDHGESFEHNIFRHHDGPHLYEQLTSIPLIIKQPDQTKGQVINNVAEQIDIPATILDLAHIPMPSWMEGRSVVPFIRGEQFDERPAFSMNLERNRSVGHQIKNGTIAVWENDYKLIHYLEENKSLLFNLRDDPDELSNLYNKESEVGKRLLNLIQDELKMANERITNEK